MKDFLLISLVIYLSIYQFWYRAWRSVMCYIPRRLSSNSGQSSCLSILVAGIIGISTIYSFFIISSLFHTVVTKKESEKRLNGLSGERHKTYEDDIWGFGWPHLARERLINSLSQLVKTWKFSLGTISTYSVFTGPKSLIGLLDGAERTALTDNQC